MNSGKDDNGRNLQRLGNALSAGLVLPVSTVIGYIIGYYLDKWLGTSFLKTVFLFFGIAAGFVSFYRIISQVEKDK
jgi:ATP synthase protein I